jgi:hypothetical protein
LIFCFAKIFGAARLPRIAGEHWRILFFEKRNVDFRTFCSIGRRLRGNRSKQFGRTMRARE